MTEFLKIRAKANQPKTQITGEKEGIVQISVKAAPENNRANIEIIKFFTKKTKRHVKIVSGLTSKDKILKID